MNILLTFIYILLFLGVNIFVQDSIVKIVLMIIPIMAIADMIIAFIEAAGGIDVRLSSDQAVPRAEPVRVHIKAEGKRIILCRRIKLWMNVTNELTGDRKRSRISILVPAKKEEELCISLSSIHSGKMRVSIEQIRLMDVFGLFGIKTKIKNKGESIYTNINVLPQLLNTQINDCRYDTLISEASYYSKTKKGQDKTEVFSIREYEKGDSLKDIHWKLSAKSEDLYVKEGSFPEDNSIMLMMDKALLLGENAKRSISADMIDALIDTTVSISAELIKQGISHQLVYNSVDENYCHIENISSEDELFLCIPDMMTGAVKEGAVSLWQLFMRLKNESHAALIIYISIDGDAHALDQFTGTKVRYVQPTVENTCN